MKAERQRKAKRKRTILKNCAKARKKRKKQQREERIRMAKIMAEHRRTQAEEKRAKRLAQKCAERSTMASYVTSSAHA